MILAVTLRQVHVAWAWVVIVLNAIAGAWALAADRYTGLRRRELWRFTAVAQIAIFVQVMLGVALVQSYDADKLQMHIFYGFGSAFTVGIIYSYRAQLKPWWYRLYGFGGLFLAGMALRSVVTGPH